MLLNLYSNAIKFTSIAGKVEIVAQIVREPLSIKISVKDNGVGIKPKDQPKIFTLFGSIKNERSKFNVKGIGLGLVISRMIAKKFNGDIVFKSKEHCGSVFSFTFMLDKVPISAENYNQ